MLEAYLSRLVLENNDDLKDLSIVRELTNNQIRQLTEYASEDPLVLANTSDSRRFGTTRAYESWLAKGRALYALTDGSDLLGMMWFGEEKAPDRNYVPTFTGEHYPFTTAQRIYGRARGHGLARPYIGASLVMALSDGVFASSPDSGIWFETSSDNFAIHKSWETFGFKKVADTDARGKIVMAARMPAIRNRLQAYGRALSTVANDLTPAVLA